MKVRDLLNKQNLITKKIINIDYHMSLLRYDVDELKIRIPELKEKSEQEIIDFILDLYDKCDSTSPNYDAQFDEQITRMSLKADVFAGGHNHNIWNNGTFHDDGFGFGSEPTSIYDDYVDSMSGGKIK